MPSRDRCNTGSFVVFAALLALACAAGDEAALERPIFSLEAGAGPAPWSHLEFQNRPEDFTFAIVSDLTGGYRSGVFEAAVERLNLLRPEFVLSVGDLIEGYTEDRARLAREWDAFDSMLEPLAAPFFYVPGNHDISNEVMREVWRERLGRSFYHLVYRDVLFLLLDTEETPLTISPEGAEQMAEIDRLRATDPDAARALGVRLAAGIDWEGTHPAEFTDEQIDYFERVIADHADVRWTFLLMHKPVWQGEGNEGLRRIESALGGRPYTAFAGHVHNYKRFEVGGRIHIRLGTTGGDWVVQGTDGNYDHLALVTMTETGPSIANLLLDGILDEHGRIGETEWRARDE